MIIFCAPTATITHECATAAVTRRAFDHIIILLFRFLNDVCIFFCSVRKRIFYTGRPVPIFKHSTYSERILDIVRANGKIIFLISVVVFVIIGKYRKQIITE